MQYDNQGDLTMPLRQTRLVASDAAKLTSLRETASSALRDFVDTPFDSCE
jgi:hypothetical protein